MTKVWILVLLPFLAGCSTINKVYFNVESEPQGAVIESNGVTLCDSTPCKIEMDCRHRGSKHKSRPVLLEAIPRASMGKDVLTIASKTVNPCSALEADQKLFFSMTAERATATDRLEIRHR